MSPKVVLDSYARQRLASLDPNVDIYSLTLEEIRADFEVVPPGAVIPDAFVVDKVIHTEQGDINITVIRPLDSETQTLPVILYLHGGGWVEGTKHSHSLIMHELAVHVHAAVVYVDYSRSPEVKYPVALEQCFASLAWIANKDNAASLSIDADKIAVAGDSSGGNLAAAVTLLDKQRKLSAIKYQILYYPVLDDDFDTPSYLEFQTGYSTTRKGMKFYWDQYVTGEERRSITACPLKAAVDDLKGLPPTYIVSVEADVLRDEAEEYARKLMEAEVDVVAVRTFGMLHAFFTKPVWSPSARAVIHQTAQLLHNAWGK
ncbi:hypothetical protein DFQ28_000783 [Apophysomyces sp. BC1034]|nr:hypothetical protein DFQ30_000157 [Apophysomyces sp. BC1015]KAG0181371.1 hypothetical protein DFQ29_008509 [Apophysomyces sp. BC1021]KAG0191180.1 hypothetical protein DFQ28_000783 [Apophysomyces sp. BC1034]